MKQHLLLLGFLASFLCAKAQMVSPTAGRVPHVLNLTRAVSDSDGELPFDDALAPFYHGVASGDPLSDRVIIWTRVTSETDEDPMVVKWYVSTDSGFESVLASGEVTTSAERDFTVKVDVTGLSPATTYYYVFRYNGVNSKIGRTRTTPTGDEVDHLKFAVVSCSNYQAGYFNAYARIAERKDIDAVIHLGDYFYEYAAGEGTYGYDESRSDRANVPGTEILELADYRTRYSLYRLDPNLRDAHQQHPFIPIWDDHETTNDAYKDGAENHNEGEGDWETRKSIGIQTWFEWMPMRESEDRSIYRTINYGDLADLIMVDTRLEGRDEQPASVAEAEETVRNLLGETQKEWLIDELTESVAKWKIIGNQIIFSQLNVGFAATDLEGNPAPTNLTFVNGTESFFLDIWDGYPHERAELIETFDTNEIDNVVILTGDFHSTFAFDVTAEPVVYPNPVFNNLPTPSMSYDPATGEGSVAVEFATPSITSANFDENISSELSAQFEFSFNNPLEPLGGVNYNPHMKYVDLDQHGYFILDLVDTAAQANWYFVDILDEKVDTETFGQAWYTKDAENHLMRADVQSPAKSSAPDLAPEATLEGEVLLSVEEGAVVRPDFVVFSVHPNPVSEEVIYLNVAFLKPSQMKLSLMDLNGVQIETLLDQRFNQGNYTVSADLPSLSAGLYLLHIETEEGVWTRKVLVTGQ